MVLFFQIQCKNMQHILRVYILSARPKAQIHLGCVHLHFAHNMVPNLGASNITFTPSIVHRCF